MSSLAETDAEFEARMESMGSRDHWGTYWERMSRKSQLMEYDQKERMIKALDRLSAALELTQKKES